MVALPVGVAQVALGNLRLRLAAVLVGQLNGSGPQDLTRVILLVPVLEATSPGKI